MDESKENQAPNPTSREQEQRTAQELAAQTIQEGAGVITGLMPFDWQARRQTGPQLVMGPTCFWSKKCRSFFSGYLGN
jgi:hypothetical protein